MNWFAAIAISVLVSSIWGFAQSKIPTLTQVIENSTTTPATSPDSLQSEPIPLAERVIESAAPQLLTAFVWDAASKEYTAQFNEKIAPFTFKFTNISAGEIVITNLKTSCGCTAAQMPENPWRIASGMDGEIKASMDLTVKQGKITKTIDVQTASGFKQLSVTVIHAPPDEVRGDRAANMELAKADRQAVFKGDCRSCHVDQGAGKLGKELYAADCGVCHDSHIRAAMVPDLRAPKAPRDRDYWLNWITYGRPGSMMPAFGEKDGGPLSKEQIDSLVDYLAKEFPQGPAVAPIPAVAPVRSSDKPGAGQ